MALKKGLLLIENMSVPSKSKLHSKERNGRISQFHFNLWLFGQFLLGISEVGGNLYCYSEKNKSLFGKHLSYSLGWIRKIPVTSWILKKHSTCVCVCVCVCVKGNGVEANELGDGLWYLTGSEGNHQFHGSLVFRIFKIQKEGQIGR